MRYEDVEHHISKITAGLVMRAREYTRSMSRWPEENSPLQKVLGLINELERMNVLLEDVVRKRQTVHKGMETRAILAQAFQSAVTQVTSSHPIVSLDPEDDSIDVFTFDGRIFSVAEVLQFLADNRRSGELKIEGLGEKFVIRLREGDVVAAVSTNSPTGLKLGEILVERYGVDRTVLEDFMKRNAGGEKLGKALAREELVSSSIIYEALRFQTVQLFERCLACEGADIVYDPRVTDLKPEGPSINLGDLLLDGILS